MKQSVDLSQGHRSNCLAGEHNLPSLRIWPLIKVTFERCPSVLHCSYQAGLGSCKYWPLCDHPRRVKHSPPDPSWAHPTFRCSCEHHTCCSGLHSLLMLFTKPCCPWPVARALCLLIPHRWTTQGHSPLTSLSNLYKIKFIARAVICAMMHTELAWRRKITEKRQQKKFNKN